MKATTDSLIIRADGSRVLGHGHVFRTLVLGRELARQGRRITYVCRDLDGAPLARIRQAGFQVCLLPGGMDEEKDAAATVEAARKHQASWIVTDRYATPPESYIRFSDEGFLTLAVDDIATCALPVDLLLNQNIDADTLDYDTRPDTVRLLGPAHALVRSVYRSERPPAPRDPRPARRVLVFMGGGDSHNVTARVVRALDRQSDLVEAQVVVGAAYPFMDDLADLAETCGITVTIHQDLPHLAGLMAWADLGISAGGSVAWEFCCMGVPMLMLPYVDNQMGIARGLDAHKAALTPGTADQVDDDRLAEAVQGLLDDPDRLAGMARAAWNLVDGRGVFRVARAMEDIRTP